MTIADILGHAVSGLVVHGRLLWHTGEEHFATTLSLYDSAHRIAVGWTEGASRGRVTDSGGIDLESQLKRILHLVGAPSGSAVLDDFLVRGVESGYLERGGSRPGWGAINLFEGGSSVVVSEPGGALVGLVLRASSGDLILPGVREAHHGSTAHSLREWLAACKRVRGEKPPLGSLMDADPSRYLGLPSADRLAAAATLLPVPVAGNAEEIRNDPARRLVLGPAIASSGWGRSRPTRVALAAADAVREQALGTVLDLVGPDENKLEVYLGTFEVSLDAAGRPLLLEVPRHLGAVLMPLTVVPGGGRRPWKEWAAAWEAEHGRVPTVTRLVPMTRLLPRVWSLDEGVTSAARIGALLALLGRVGVLSGLVREEGVWRARAVLALGPVDVISGDGGLLLRYPHPRPEDRELVLSVIGGERRGEDAVWWPLGEGPLESAGELVMRLRLLTPGRLASQWAVLERVELGRACWLYARAPGAAGGHGVGPEASALPGERFIGLWRVIEGSGGFRALLSPDGARFDRWLLANPGVIPSRAVALTERGTSMHPSFILQLHGLAGTPRYEVRAEGLLWTVVDVLGARPILPGPVREADARRYAASLNASDAMTKE